MGMHSAKAVDLENAIFSVDPSRIVAIRNESDWLIFEELLPIGHTPVE